MAMNKVAASAASEQTRKSWQTIPQGKIRIDALAADAASLFGADYPWAPRNAPPTAKRIRPLRGRGKVVLLYVYRGLREALRPRLKASVRYAAGRKFTDASVR